MEMLSLFDYLGKPAGGDLGRQVALAAMNEKIQIETKQVSNPKYKGTILMYPKSWLDRYFNNGQENDLPF